MPMTHFPKTAEKFEIQAYRRPKKNIQELKKHHVSFTGSPQKHPYDSSRVILIVDPYSANTFYYEFNKQSIAFVEDLPSIVNAEGESIMMARLWIKKKSIGIHCTPFVVEDVMQFR